MNRFFYGIFFLLVCTSAHAFLPSTGIWYNPAESGRGYDIEIQGNTMAVATYVYDQSGKQLWYTSGGTYNEATRTFTSTFDSATGGQCFGCAYVNPTRHVGAGGTITIVFNSYESATLIFPGGSTAIRHFNYGYSGNLGYFYGEWSFSFNISGLVSAQWVVFPGTTYTDSQGTLYATGYEDAVSGTLALGLYNATSGAYGVAIEDNVGYTYTYGFNGDTQRMLGLGWIEPTGTTTLTGNGSPAVGSRLLAQSQLSTIVANAANAVGVQQTVPTTQSARFEILAARLRTHMQQLPN